MKMRKFLLSVLLAQILLSTIAHAELVYDKELLTRVFWDNLKYNGTEVDFSAVPPNYDEATDRSAEERSSVGYKGYWLQYWQDENARLEWKGISFNAGEEPPVFDEWAHWDSYYVSIWGDFFTAQYYFGGDQNPLLGSDYLLFWEGLYIGDEKIDPYQAPPNYDVEMDVWRDQRGTIGYHWYWQLFLGSEYSSDEYSNEIRWNNVSFDPSEEPDNYDENKDAFCTLRGAIGYMDYWAALFLNKDSDPIGGCLNAETEGP